MTDRDREHPRSSPDPSIPTPPARRRWRRRLAIATGVMLGMLVVVRMLLPTVIERGAAWAGPRYLGLPIRIANVDLALFSGALTIEGLAIGSRADAVLPVPEAVVREPERQDREAPARGDLEGESPAAAGVAGEPGVAPAPEPGLAIEDPEPEATEQRELLVSWSRVHARLDYRALFDRTLRLHALEIDAPEVRLERQPDGRIDPLAHAEPTAPPTEAEAPAVEEPSGEPWAVHVEQLTLRSPDVRIIDEAADVVLVDFGLEELTLGDIEVRGADLSLGSVGIDGPVLRVRRDFVFGASETPPAPVAPSPAPAAPSAPPDDEAAPSYRIERLAIDRAQFVWITEVGPLDVALTLAAEGLTATEGEWFPLALTLEIGAGRFVVDGQVGILPPRYEGRITWEQLPFPPLAVAARPDVAPWLRSVRSQGDLQVSARLAKTDAGPAGIQLSGPLMLEALEFGDPKGQEVGVGWQTLEIAIRDLQVPIPEDGAPRGAIRVDLERVRLVAPELSYTPPTPLLDALLGVEGQGAAAASEPEQTPGAETPEAGTTEIEAAAPEPAPPGSEEAAPAEPEPAERRTAESEPPDAPAPGAPLEVDVAAVELSGGRLQFADRRGPGGPLTGTIEGLDVVADSLAVRTTDGGMTVTLGSLTLDGDEIRFEDARAERPQGGGVDGLHVTLGRLALTPGPDALSIALATLGLDADAIQFEDQKVEPTYRGRLRNVVVRAEELRFPERLARSLHATGTSADGGRFELTGTLDGDSGEAKLELKGLALAPFDPYARRAAGYRIAGDASLKTNLRIRGARYDARSRIVLGDLDVSSQDPGDFEKRFGVPLDLALALLRDPTGNISLSIPVSVDETGTRTGLATIIAGALRQALIGALTAPLKMLGSVASGVGGLFSGAGAGIAPIAVAAGATEPEPGQDERYEGFVKLLAKRPELALWLRGRTGPDDRPRVAEQMLIERVKRGDGLPELEDGAGFLQRRRLTGALEKRGRGEPGELDPDDAAMLERYVAAVDVPDERLTALARARAEAVREIATSEYGVAPSHLLVADPAPPGPPAVLLELTPAPPPLD
ncbi:AsmA family protein [Myxococcota bacterium]|nr:AsmA family protein [Myxococcota bacterium]